MQLAQSGSESTAPKEPASRVWPQRVVTGPVRGTLGVRWIRPPDLRRTDSRRTRCTPKSWGVELAQDRGPVFPCQATSNLPPKIWAETHLQIEPARPNDNPPGRGAPVGAYVEPMSLLIVPARTTLRRQSLHLTEELDFDPRAVRRAVAALELRAGRAHTLGLSIRVDLHGLKVADVRRARLHPGATQARGGHEVCLEVGENPLPDPSRRAALCLPARVAALVPARGAGQTIWRGDRLRPVRASQLPPPSGHDRRRSGGDPRPQDAPAVRGASPGSLGLRRPPTPFCAKHAKRRPQDRPLLRETRLLST